MERHFANSLTGGATENSFDVTIKTRVHSDALTATQLSIHHPAECTGPGLHLHRVRSTPDMTSVAKFSHGIIDSDRKRMRFLRMISESIFVCISFIYMLHHWRPKSTLRRKQENQFHNPDTEPRLSCFKVRGQLFSQVSCKIPATGTGFPHGQKEKYHTLFVSCFKVLTISALQV